MVSEAAQSAKDSARKQLRSRVAGLQGGFGDLRTRIESLTVNFESFEQRLASGDLLIADRLHHCLRCSAASTPPTLPAAALRSLNDAPCPLFTSHGASIT
jgi:hypothetical protein